MAKSTISMAIFNSHVCLPEGNIDPENKQVLMETYLPSPMNARVYVNLLGGI